MRTGERAVICEHARTLFAGVVSVGACRHMHGVDVPAEVVRAVEDLISKIIFKIAGNLKFFIN